MNDDLITRWTGPVERLGAQHALSVEGERLVAAYAKSQRRYHDTAHLRAVLDRVDELERFARDPDVVRVAAWFHDAVHDPAREDNEAISAALAETVLDRLDVDEDTVAEVARLVRLTADHAAAPDDRNGHVLCDADLAVLGGSSEEYISYAAAVRLEYAHLDDAAFARGRTDVLRRLLERPRIFRTPTGRAAWEDAARRNLAQEIGFLSASL